MGVSARAPAYPCAAPGPAAARSGFRGPAGSARRPVGRGRGRVRAGGGASVSLGGRGAGHVVPGPARPKTEACGRCRVFAGSGPAVGVTCGGARGKDSAVVSGPQAWRPVGVGAGLGVRRQRGGAPGECRGAGPGPPPAPGLWALTWRGGGAFRWGCEGRASPPESPDAGGCVGGPGLSPELVLEASGGEGTSCLCPCSPASSAQPRLDQNCLQRLRCYRTTLRAKPKPQAVSDRR